MKALILKDLFTLFKQLKFFLLVIVVFACLPGSSFAGFAIIYAAMLPITALAYDERSKWNHLAAMMPYSTSRLVLSKYVLGYLLTAAAVVLSVATQFVVALVRRISFGGVDLITGLLFFCIALILQSINLPFMFRFGVEKGRLAFILLIVISTSVMTLGQNILKMFASVTGNMMLALAIAALAAVAINAVSIFASKKLYQNAKN